MFGFRTAWLTRYEHTTILPGLAAGLKARPACCDVIILAGQARTNPPTPPTADGADNSNSNQRGRCSPSSQTKPSRPLQYYQPNHSKHRYHPTVNLESLFYLPVSFVKHRAHRNRHIFPSKAGTGTSQLKSSISFLLLCEHQKEYEANASGNWLRRLTKYLLSVESVEFGFAADQTKSFHT